MRKRTLFLDKIFLFFVNIVASVRTCFAEAISFYFFLFFLFLEESRRPFVLEVEGIIPAGGTPARAGHKIDAPATG